METEAQNVPAEESLSTMGELIDAYLDADALVERLRPVYGRAATRQADTSTALAACLRDKGPIVHDGWVYSVKLASGGQAILRTPLVESSTMIPAGMKPLPKRAKEGAEWALSLMRKHPQI